MLTWLSSFAILESTEKTKDKTMTYDDFCKTAVAHGATPVGKMGYSSVDDLAFWVRWTNSSEDSCWQDDSITYHTYAVPASEKSLDELYEFIESEFPATTFIIGRKVERAVVDEDYADSDYYTVAHMVCRYITVKKLYEILVDD
jgi:hypothetical protein